MAAGNRSVLVVLDSRRRVARIGADGSVFAALDHFGVAWEVLECGDYMGSPPGHLQARAAYVLAHDGAGAGLTDAQAQTIAAEVAAGAGFVSFDREIDSWPQALAALAPATGPAEEVAALEFTDDGGFIAFGHEQDERIEFDMPLSARTLRIQAPWRPLLRTPGGACAAATGTAGQGRVVVFGCGERLWADEVFGHVRGVDGLMWRALVWVARKPFPMRCIPPFVSARMDDCNGTYGAFAYVEAMNRHGIRPNLGLFIDEMGPTDWTAAKRLYDSGGADFSMHAFRDDFYVALPNYRPYAVLPDKPDLSQGGKQTLFEGLSVCHVSGRDLPDETILRNFRRMDEAFSRAGIRHSRIVNAHFGEIANRAVPLFLERGADMPSNNSAVGQLYGNQPPYRPRPYGIRGLTGRHGLVIDRCPQHPGMTFINMSQSHLGATHMAGDILSGLVPFIGEADSPMLPEAIDRGSANVKFGLDALAFGIIMTHEERINVISPEDWRTVIDGIMRGLEGWDLECTGREHVSIITRRLLDSRLVRAELTADGLECELCGVTDGPSPLTVWENEGDGCVRRVEEVERLEGFGRVVV
jgi:hypothetical protein